MLTTEKELMRATIFELIEKRTERRLTVTPGAARLLIIGFERAGHLIVNDETNVRLVDAHTESICRHDRFQITGHERFLVFPALTRLHAPVILLDLEVETLEPIGERFDCFDGGAIDDSGAVMFAQHLHQLFVLLALVRNSLHFETKVRTVDTSSDDAKLSDVQLLLDVGS